LPGGDCEPWLSCADLAVARVDEIDKPVRHRTRVSVFNFMDTKGQSGPLENGSAGERTDGDGP
jgi:hypothetical protein